MPNDKDNYESLIQWAIEFEDEERALLEWLTPPAEFTDEVTDHEMALLAQLQWEEWDAEEDAGIQDNYYGWARGEIERDWRRFAPDACRAHYNDEVEEYWEAQAEFDELIEWAIAFEEEEKR